MTGFTKPVQKKVIRIYADVFSARIRELFQAVKKANKKYKNILLEFQDVLKKVARWGADEKQKLVDETANGYLQPSVDIIYDSFLDVVRAVWREAFLLNDRVPQVELQKNLLRLDSICVACAADLIDSTLANQVLTTHQTINPYAPRVSQDSQGRGAKAESQVEEESESESEQEQEEDDEQANDTDSGSEQDEEPDSEAEDPASQIVPIDEDSEDYNDQEQIVDVPAVHTKTIVLDDDEEESEIVTTSEESDYEIISEDEQEPTHPSRISMEHDHGDDPELAPEPEDVKIVTINDRLVKQKHAVKKKLLQSRHHKHGGGSSFF
jgi:hypothetical protein